MPARSTCACSPGAISSSRTGMRCTTFTQLPLAFCAGSTLNSEPELGAIEATRAFHFTPG